MGRGNLELWNEYGDYLIPIMPFLDSVIVRSEGSYLIDAEGNRILDLASGQFCTVLGHGHPEFTAALVDELRSNLHTGSQYVTEGVLKTAKEVADRAPGDLNKVTLLSTGSEANEFALRIAKACTNRSLVAGFDRGYYGISLATRNLSRISEGKIDFTPTTPGAYLIAPNCARCPIALRYPDCELSCLDLSIRLAGSSLEQCAAIIVETIVSAGGMIYPTKDYLHRLRSFASEIGAMFIVDEAQTGFGRCGRWFDCENLELQPDILVFSKTSGNGYPSAGVVISDEVNDRLLERGFNHLSSHQNDPLTAAAVSAVIRVIDSEGLLARSAERGEYFLDRLRELESASPHLTATRGRGLMIAFELVQDKESRVPYADALVPFVLACKARGVHVTYTYYEGAVRVIPPLTITQQEIDFAIDVFGEVLRDFAQGKVDKAEYQQKNHVIARVNRGRGVKRLINRLWETSPEHWYRKIKQRI
ncbi:MAG TPA: aspartate aminotransferase family protein [Candidatus Polarisedimenticolaceae bacterium]|nr:aspartate aminotransferase family protein [Candidatus Polarisedimenticolaceae bacterium]